jgi:hypothetical protein
MGKVTAFAPDRRQTAHKRNLSLLDKNAGQAKIKNIMGEDRFFLIHDFGLPRHFVPRNDTTFPSLRAQRGNPYLKQQKECH